MQPNVGSTFTTLLSGRQEGPYVSGAYVYCPNRTHQKLLPLTVRFEKGIRESSLSTPYYRAAEVATEMEKNPSKKRELKAVLEHERQKKAFLEYERQKPVEGTQEFLSTIQLEAQKAIFEATHFESLPKYLFDLRKGDIISTRSVVRVRDPLFELQDGKIYGREKDVRILDFTGQIKLYALI
jgi:hypothetical protein